MNYGVLLFDFGTTGGVAAGTSVDRQQSQFRKLNTAPGASAPLPTPLAPALVWGGLSTKSTTGNSWGTGGRVLPPGFVCMAQAAGCMARRRRGGDASQLGTVLRWWWSP